VTRQFAESYVNYSLLKYHELLVSEPNLVVSNLENILGLLIYNKPLSNLY
jgi:hypothetical protein